MVTVNIRKIKLNNATENCLPKLLMLLNEWELKVVGLTKRFDGKKVGNCFIGQYLPIRCRCSCIKSEIELSF